ncbi:hypothetical protein ASE63_23480 [Bosea sp. Root381]|uniref:rhodanese-like domain-containing protein n=1 Tax=Bosea sp. Root381 TaxID=1736524 RepID=UPI0006F66C01|nr:rhodanese-like domain-containing protein [Bosea sp. Root381]KRE06918.1 hypothetical protein ASE63_23480 [Bosea sp. Root381]
MSLAYDLPGSAKAHSAIATISAEELRRQALAGREIAVVDARAQERYLAGHISIAVELPLSEIELHAADLLPRRSVTVVVTDDDGGELAFAAARRLTELGYSDARVLEGGLAGWRKAGHGLITGQYALSKALGEFIERRYHTPRIDAQTLRARIDSGEELVILDTRPLDEFHHIAIPGGIAAPGAELLYRIFDQIPSPETPVVINCAGRTRAIIGAQALRNAGFPNPVVSLENGTTAWLLAGYEPARGATALADRPTTEGLARAEQAASGLVERFGIRTLSKADLAEFKAQAAEQTLYLFDVRTTEEYLAGHLPGTRSAPGGQLVQTTDRFVGVRQGRIVLVDDQDLVRSRISASWLIQLGHENVYVYAASADALTEHGAQTSRVLGNGASAKTLTVQELHQRLVAGDVALVDLEPAPPYFRERRYIPGSHVARRATLADNLSRIPGVGAIVLTSADGELARLAAADLAGQDRPVLALAGGTQAWIEAGLERRSGLDQPAFDPAEALPPLPTLAQRRSNLAAYVSWGDDITDLLARDGLVRFREGAH